MTYKPKDTRERIIHRLKIARGHLDKVINMVEEDAYCIDVIMQSKAVQAAIKEADNLLLENHLKKCVADAMKKSKKDEAITEVMNVFKKSTL